MAKTQGQIMFVDGEHKPYIEESTEETIMTWTMMDEEEDRLLCFAMKCSSECYINLENRNL
ncbi:unnamed protein product [Brassica rapa subsp. narinosa]